MLPHSLGEGDSHSYRSGFSASTLSGGSSQFCKEGSQEEGNRRVFSQLLPRLEVWDGKGGQVAVLCHKNSAHLPYLQG